MNMGELLPDGIWEIKPEVVYIDIEVAAVGKYSSDIGSTFKASIGNTVVKNVLSDDVPTFNQQKRPIPTIFQRMTTA